MPLPQFVPLLAIDVGFLIFIVFIAISIINWLIQTVGAQQKQPQPPPRPVRAGQGQDRLKREIEDFLREVGGNRPERRGAKREEAGIEIVPERERAKQPQQRRPQPQRPRRQPSKAKTPLKPAPPAEPMPPSPSLALGEELRSQLADAAATRGDDAFGRSHLDAPMDFRPNLAKSEDEPHELVKLLRQPAGIRQAIILQEILTRPSERKRQSI
jgi:hypothetical protein